MSEPLIAGPPKYMASVRCIEKLKQLEGFRATVYRDGGGLYTIGFGRRCNADEPETTPEKETPWLKQRLAELCASFDLNMPGLSQCQLDALCLLCYNIGLGQFYDSLTCIHLRKREAIALSYWQDWVRDAKHETEPGLVTRRAFETGLFVWGWQ